MCKPKIAYHSITWYLDYVKLEVVVRDIADIRCKGLEVLDTSSVLRD